MADKRDKIKGPLYKRILRVFFICILSVVLLLVAAVLLIRTEPVQNFLKAKAIVYLQGKIHTKVEVGRIYIDFPKSVVIENVLVCDRQKDTLLCAAKLLIDISMMKLLQNKVEISHFLLEHATVKIKRQLPDTTFNFQFIIDAFSSPAKQPAAEKKSPPTQFEVGEVNWEDIRFVYADVVTGEDMDLRVKHLKLNVNHLDLTAPFVEIADLEVDSLQGKAYQHPPFPAQQIPGPATSATPSSLHFNWKTILLKNIGLDYRNEPGAFFASVNLGNLGLGAGTFDLGKKSVALDEIQLAGTVASIRLGKTGTTQQAAPAGPVGQAIPNAPSWQIAVKKITVNDNNIGFDNDNAPHQKDGMDYAHIKTTGLTLHVDHFFYSADSIGGDISRGMFTEQCGFRLQSLQGSFLYGAKQAYLKNFTLRTAHSTLQSLVAIRYPSLDALKKKMGQLIISADLHHSSIQVKDILTFAPTLGTVALFKDPAAVFTASAKMEGSLGNLKIQLLQLAGLQGTSLELSGSVKGLPDMRALQSDLLVKKISTTRKDILDMIPVKNLPQGIAIPETVSLSGSVKGGAQRLFADLSLNTSSGRAEIKGNFAHLTDIDNIGYDLVVSADNLDLGYLLKDDSTYGPVSLQIKATGQGADLRSARAQWEGTVRQAVYKNYNYRNIDFHASIEQHIVNATLGIHDKNISLALDGRADLVSHYPGIRITLVIDSLLTRPLHWTTTDLAYHGAIHADFPLTDPDSLQGVLTVAHSQINASGKQISLDSLKLIAGQTDSGEYLSLTADAVNAALSGHYRLTDMGDVFKHLLDPYFNLSHPAAKRTPSPFDFSLSIDVLDKPVLQMLLPGLKKLEPVHFRSHFSSSRGWEADLRAPLVVYGNLRSQNLGLHIKPQSNGLQVEAGIQQFTSGQSVALYNTTLGGLLADNKMDFSVNIQDKAAKDKYQLHAWLQQKDSGVYYFSLKPDKLLLNYQKWSIDEDNFIRYGPAVLGAHDFDLRKNDEQLAINSTSGAPDAPLEISFAHFLLSTLTAFAGTDSLFLNGELNGKVSVRDVQSKPTFTSDLLVSNLSAYKDTVGDVAIKVSSSAQDKFVADIHVSGKGNDLALTGSYQVTAGDSSQADLELDMRNLELASLAGIFHGSLKSASGSVNGKFSIKGSLDKPRFSGKIAFARADIDPAMLSSHFLIDGQQLAIDQDGIRLHQFTILDSAKNKLVLDGSVLTSDYSQYKLDLTLKAKNFQALNSTQRDNKLYYGKLLFDANLRILGTALQPSVDGSLKVNDKTRLTVMLPQDEPGIAERQGIVQFVDMKSPQKDSVLTGGYDSIRTSSIVGMDISTNISIDSGAELNMIIDESNGDHLTARGLATLTGGIDRSGNTSLSGTYLLSRGSYDLTLSVLHRQFQIQNGSAITWIGEPTKANLNINAVYTASASPIDLVSDQIAQTSATRNTYLQNLPFQVMLKMRGELLKPDISFDIILPDNSVSSVSRDVTSTVQTKLDILRQDPGEMNKQVFALLLLGRFVGDDPFASEAAGFNAESMVRQSVSKLLSQQLNRLAGNLVHGVDVNFDLQSTDDYTTGQLQNRTDLNVMVSKQLLNDRLRVSVGSDFELEGPQNVNPNQQSNTLAGNIALDYKLSKDGRYLLRAYRKNDYDDVVEGYVIETGLGFLITIDYDHFKEIFQSKKKKEKLEKKDLDATGPQGPQAPGDDKKD